MASLCACASPSAPTAIRTCDAIDENTLHPNGPSRVELVLANESDHVVNGVSVFVAWGAGGYGFPIRVRREIRPHASVAATYRLSNSENLYLVGAKWRYGCYVESVRFEDDWPSWSGAARSYWPMI